MTSARQGDLFGEPQPDLFDEDAPTPVYRADPDEVRAELYKILAEARAAKTLKESLPFWFCCRAARPAFHDFEGEKPEQQLLRRFQIEP